MDYGLFLPTTNGSIPSTTAPREQPSFELNRKICQRGESYGFSFALSLVKLRGFGGPSEYWDYALDSLTLTAALAASTEHMHLFASVATPTLHPAMVARMVMTLESIAPGRVGLNIVSAWNKSEYAQMGLWPGDDFYGARYDYAAEYATVLRQLWSRGRSDFRGQYFELDDCACQPQPSTHIPLVSAGASESGRQFAADHCDYNFTVIQGGLSGVAAANQDLHQRAAANGRDVGCYLTTTVILGETDEEARAKRDLYNSGLDSEAIARFTAQAGLGGSSAGAQLAVARKANAVDTTAVVGGPASVAAQLNEIAAIPGVSGILLSFDDFTEAVERFGRQVMPLLD